LIYRRISSREDKHLSRTKSKEDAYKSYGDDYLIYKIPAKRPHTSNRKDQQPPITGQDGLKTIETIERCLKMIKN